MIYAAALHRSEFVETDFLEVISHNLEFTRTPFGFTSWCETFRLPGQRYSLTLYRVKPDAGQNIECNDLTVAIIFNRDYEKDVKDDHYLLHMQAIQPELQFWLNVLVGECHTLDGFRNYTIQNGNSVLILQNIQRYEWLESKFGF
jgi:hypothetical protein